ncbi:SIR2 family protein [Clavibacter capsici]|uniref:SIR2 family NAD-dependent protein deacylase n=1 Tax=Clavibacter capsici TaxID=1874630 RepID=UPI001428827A|nr:SIR2 family protein [Clavibacter capsici]QIS43182.1 SIR2 family protein [Clavibacter capsici]
MFDLSDLITKINPRQTALLLGAGASIPSGAPSGSDLARALFVRGRLPGAANYTLPEIAGLFEQRHGRRALAEGVRAELQDLRPTGGLQLLPRFDWYRIYTTNFDTLVEQVYDSSPKALAVRRSNYDFSGTQEPSAIDLFKIHGCVSEDVGFGHRGRMLLTENDYDTYASFQEAAFRALAADILTKDFLIIGQSLSDPHLKQLVRDALKLQNTAGLSGRIFLLTFERDEGLAELQQARGAEVYFGSLDELFSRLLESLPDEEEPGDPEFVPTMLPAELISVSTDVSHALTLESNARAIFNGSPARYADIASGNTFVRSDQARVLAGLGERPIVVILGAGGVGKTTLARQVTVTLGEARDSAWEHNNAFPLRPEFWIEYEQRLRDSSKSAVLFVDDCVDHLPAVSRIAEHIGRLEVSALSLVLTATTGKWKQRSKSRYVFSHGNAYTLSRLSDQDISALLALTGSKEPIKELVNPDFLRRPRGEQVRILRERCSADMYVCMKNIFATEELDYILLREFGELDEDAQGLYRYVAALEALGARVHRQLIMRLLGIEAGSLAALLDRLTGVISEFDIRPRDGLFGWATRHRVIATTIATYKYADQEELDRLFVDLIAAINPSVRLEVDTARALCSEEMGIDRLTDPRRQVELLAAVVRLLPGESVPRHRLIRHLIDQERLDEAATELRRAHEVLRPNPVMTRYDVLLLSRKADLAPGLMEEDRKAILLDAYAQAVQMVRRYKDDMYCFRLLIDVATRLVDKAGPLAALEEAIALSREAEPRILDPVLTEAITRGELELTRRSPRCAELD